MERIASRYQLHTTPVCNPAAVIQGKDYRFTILTSALIRAEYNENGQFEDRATQAVINRQFPVPVFHSEQKNGMLRITTDEVELVYYGGPFTRNSLLLRMNSLREDWHWGDHSRVLPGTVRTLDEVNGECPLGSSILAVSGIAVLDDSKSLILADDGWVNPRMGEHTDAYLFCHHHDYKRALQDYCALTGTIPLLPRYAFGNWWSRYHQYTQQEYSDLMARFRKEDLPFSVAVIDIDWHKVKIDPRYGSGWTGWTWDKDAFPDHCALLKELHDHGMEVTLNLHPAEGFAAHEACYPEMARRMGIDPTTEEKVRFDVTDPKLLENYFDAVLHPMEEEGVTFWWMDWQQGNTTSIPGLDPLWMLNHYHFLDMMSSGKRPMIFSRYAGHGSQRYPVGFSGDTYVTWDSLQFQPYFTSMASNVDYCWWSHDIGGHMHGSKDDELTGRWVQYGTFSPIMRLHSTNSPFMSKEPWRFSRDTYACMKRFLQLRHRMIPYLYSMNKRTADTCMPLVAPLYFEEPENEIVYHQRNEYYFGTELLVNPITEHADDVTLMGAVTTWLPAGTWFDAFTGFAYDGGRMVCNYRTLDEMPVFARSGAIIPMAVPQSVNDISNPGRMELQVFPGADRSFTLYEDDGRTNGYQQGACVNTEILWQWGKEAVLTIRRPVGDLSLIPADRSYTVVFRSTEAADISANVPCTVSRTEKGIEVSLSPTEQEIILHLHDCSIAANRVTEKAFEILERAHWVHFRKADALHLIESDKPLSHVIASMDALDVPEHLRKALIEILTAKN